MSKPLVRLLYVLFLVGVFAGCGSTDARSDPTDGGRDGDLNADVNDVDVSETTDTRPDVPTDKGGDGDVEPDMVGADSDNDSILDDVESGDTSTATPPADTDMDGVGDNADAFPNDPDESSPSTSTIMSNTTQKFIRVRGRQMAVKFRSTGTDEKWRLGDSRIDIRPDGRR